MFIQMDQLYNPLRTRPIQTGREISIEPYTNGRFGYIDDLDPDPKQRCRTVVNNTYWTFSGVGNVQSTLVQNRGVSEMGYMSKGTVCISKYPHSVIF